MIMPKHQGVDEIATMAVHLATDDARHITGRDINVCDGSVFYQESAAIEVGTN